MPIDTHKKIVDTPPRKSPKKIIFLWINAQLDTEKPGTIPALNGIRAIACLMVIAFHINLIGRERHFWQQTGKPLFSSLVLSGDTGVTLFFLLSGILLFMPYAKALLYEHHWPDFRQFYMRRALRILPGYYISLFLIILFQRQEYLRPDHWKQLLLFIFFLMDSSTSTFHFLNGPYWTLAVEWQFYLFLPIIAVGFRTVVRRFRAEYRLSAIIGCLLALIGWGLFSSYTGELLLSGRIHFPVPRLLERMYVALTYGMVSKFLEVFAIGMLISVIYLYCTKEGKERLIKRISDLLWRGGILWLIFICVRHYSADYHQHWLLFSGLLESNAWLNQFGFSLGYGAMILAILFGPTYLRAIFEWTPLYLIGVLSYGLYIWHMPLIYPFEAFQELTLHLSQPYLSYILYLAWITLVITPFCFLFYKLVERPGMQLGDRFREKMRTHALAHQKSKQLKEKVEQEQESSLVS